MVSLQKNSLTFNIQI